MRPMSAAALQTHPYPAAVDVRRTRLGGFDVAPFTHER